MVSDEPTGLRWTQKPQSLWLGESDTATIRPSQSNDPKQSTRHTRRATLTVSLFLYIDIGLFLFFLVYSLQPLAQVFVF